MIDKVATKPVSVMMQELDYFPLIIYIAWTASLVESRPTVNLQTFQLFSAFDRIPLW